MPTDMIIGVDEVGRGCLAGPVSVGAAAVTTHHCPPPQGLTDSKLLTPAKREALYDPIKKWVSGVAVGHASPGDIDTWGITVALRLAGRRALQQLVDQGIECDNILLDGKFDWLTIPPPDLLTPPDHPDRDTTLVQPTHVTTAIKADLTYPVVSAASVIAKVERDAIMVGLHERYPQYGWDHNKGYGSAAHRRAIMEYGATDIHRRSWKLPTRASVKTTNK